MAWGSGTLRQGASGPDVKQLQEFLKSRGYDPGPVDGVYGPRTVAAVRAMQSANHITADGVVGPATWGKITSVSSKPAPAKATATTKKPADLEAQIRTEFPALAPFLDVPELKSILVKAAKENWTPDRFLAEVRGTSWWKNRTLTQQEWVSLPQAEKNSRVDQTAATMIQYYIQLYGMDYMRKNLRAKLDPNSKETKAVAEKIASGRMSIEEWQFQALSSALKQPKSLASITQRESEASTRRTALRPEEIAEELFITARQNFWVPMTKADALVWAKRINDGISSEADFHDYLRTQASGLYPDYAKQIAGGVEPGVLFAPYTNIAAEELGISADAVVMDDRIFGTFFDQSLHGQFPSAGAFRAHIRSLDEWRYGEKANQLGSDGALSILQTFGEVA